MTKTLAQLAKEALQVQDASNLSGVLHSAAKAIGNLREIAEAEGKSWEWVDHHPIMKLWSDKIANMTGTQYDSDSATSAAYAECRRLESVQ